MPDNSEEANFPTEDFMNEYNTRKNLIDKRLIRSKWGLNDKRQVRPEYPVDIVENEVKSNRFIDYVLFDNVGDPISIIEAKKWSRDPYEGKKQAKEYADYLEMANQKICFIFLTNGEDILFWDRSKYPPRKVMGFFTQEELIRRRKQNQSTSTLSQMKINDSIIDRPYQIEAVKRVTESFEKGKRRFLLVLATGTGKTRIAMSLIDLLLRSGKALKILFLTDRTALRDQAYGDLGESGFKQFFPNELKQQIFSGNFDHGKRLFVATLQTMTEVYKDISPGFFDVIFSDEAHRSIYGK